MRSIRRSNIIHAAIGRDHLTTACGLAVDGYWQLCDGRPVTCPGCKKVEDDRLREGIAWDRRFPGGYDVS